MNARGSATLLSHTGGDKSLSTCHGESSSTRVLTAGSYMGGAGSHSFLNRMQFALAQSEIGCTHMIIRFSLFLFMERANNIA